MTSKPLRPAFNFNLEALRGVAAALVVWHHVIYHQRQLDPAYVPTGIGAYNPPGHFAVIIFFLLSGYVIGTSHPEPLPGRGILPYLRKRFVRLYPMYVVAVLAGVVVSGFTIPLRTVVQHLGFWQSWGDPVMFENNPLWSLQYEVLYYLAFIPLSWLAIRPWRAALAMMVLGAGALFLKQPSFSGALAQYLIGFAFWTLGWALATVRTAGGPPPWPRLVSALLLLLCLEHLNPLTLLAIEVGNWCAAHQLPWNAVVWGLDYASLPYAALILLCVAGVRLPRLRVISLLLQLLPLYGVVDVARHWPGPGTRELLIPCVLYLASLALYFARGPRTTAASQYVLRRLMPLGAISYGLYVIHFPILFTFGRITTFSGTPTTFVMRAIGYLLLVFLAATWLDKKFQPWMKKRLAATSEPLPK